MSTVGKWWGRLCYRSQTSPTWIPSGNYDPVGPYVYEPVSGKWFGLFVNHSPYDIVIKERFVSSNLASINYGSAVGGFPIGQGLFAYGGFLYGLRRTVQNGQNASTVLFKVNVSTGAVTDVKTIYTATGALYSMSFVFDGGTKVYVASLVSITVLNISSYDLVSDIVTSLRDEVTYRGVPIGMGVDTTTLYWIAHNETFSSAPYDHYVCKMTTGGASFSETTKNKASLLVGCLGYRGFHFFVDETTVQIQGGSSFDLGVNPIQVFVDDSQGAASARFFVFYSNAGTPTFREYDGTTVKKTLVGTGNVLGNHGVWPIQPHATIEQAATIIAHGRAQHVEIPSNMKEVV